MKKLLPLLFIFFNIKDIKSIEDESSIIGPNIVSILEYYPTFCNITSRLELPQILNLQACCKDLRTNPLLSFSDSAQEIVRESSDQARALKKYAELNKKIDEIEDEISEKIIFSIYRAKTRAMFKENNLSGLKKRRAESSKGKWPLSLENGLLVMENIQLKKNLEKAFLISSIVIGDYIFQKFARPRLEKLLLKDNKKNLDFKKFSIIMSRIAWGAGCFLISGIAWWFMSRSMTDHKQKLLNRGWEGIF